MTPGQKSKHGGKSHCAENTRRGSEPVGAVHNHGKVNQRRRCRSVNVSPLVHGAEMRVAETRAVNRALHKAYGIGICSVEEIGSSQCVPAVFHRLPHSVYQSDARDDPAIPRGCLQRFRVNGNRDDARRWCYDDGREGKAPLL